MPSGNDRWKAGRFTAETQRRRGSEWPLRRRGIRRGSQIRAIYPMSSGDGRWTNRSPLAADPPSGLPSIDEFSLGDGKELRIGQPR
jgi:hypothetical protein